MSDRVWEKVFSLEVCGDNGSWWDIVMAENIEEAEKKVKEVYGKHHKRVKVLTREEYDYYIK